MYGERYGLATLNKGVQSIRYGGLDLTHIPQFRIKPENLEMPKSFSQDDGDKLLQFIDGAEAEHLTELNELDNVNATLAAFKVR